MTQIPRQPTEECAKHPFKTTPMVKQYLSVKEKYKDSILFFRMGDFYEMFFEDAETASPILEIALTSRNKKDASSIPMCGIPAKAADNYIGKLIDHGYKVAICDQIEDPALAKGLVERDVVRVITPGMILDNQFLDEKTNNYLLSINRFDTIIGMAYIDISTGSFRVTESGDMNAVLDEARRISPSEIIFPESSQNDPMLAPAITLFTEKSVSFISDKSFEYQEGKETLTEQFKTRSLEGFGCEHLNAGIGAAGALLFYVNNSQKQRIDHVSSLETYCLSSYLIVDDISCRNLELIQNIRTGSRRGTLLGIMDKTVTAMGARLLKQWIKYPLFNEKDIRRRLDAVEEAKNALAIRKSVREKLKYVFDIERLGSRITMGRSNARDMVTLKNSINCLPDILSELAGFHTSIFIINNPDSAEMLQNLYHLSEHIEHAIREDAPLTISEGGVIKEGYSKELDELITISRDGKGWLARLEAQERKKTGINSLKVSYNKVFGYYIEISKIHSEKIPEHYIRKQTLVNAERYITDELKSFESKVLGAHEQRALLEYELFNKLRDHVIQNNTGLLMIAKFISRLDCLFNLAEIADQNGYSKPDISDDGTIHIEDGRHPVVEKLISGERFVPNTVHMDNTENQILVITGPNMAGKSTALRQVALTILMAQMGSFVPASKAAISITDRIFTRVGALDNLSSGQSTFMVEMEETANILNHATSQSLIIMDEIGRGTSTFDGLSIAWSVAEYLHDLNGTGVKTLFATHYHELTELACTKHKVRNYNIAVKEWNDEIIFLRKLVQGGTNRSYGIQVARLAGLPALVISRAKKVLAKIEDGEPITGKVHPGEDADNLNGSRQKQLTLFRKPEQVIVDSLLKLNISAMTPIDALNYLNDLKEKADKISK